MSSAYYRYLEPLLPAVKDKVVLSSDAGSSGFLLRFTDDTWVAACLEGERLAFRLGSGDPDGSVRAQLSSPAFGDGAHPLAYAYPYGFEPCDIASAVSQSQGQPITAIAYGETAFSFRFLNRIELDTMVVKDAQGRTALRVFWEQW